MADGTTGTITILPDGGNKVMIKYAQTCDNLAAIDVLFVIEDTRAR
jgi:hypothetical protein